MNWIKSLLAGSSGDPSTMRVAMLLVITATLVNWVYLTIHSGVMQKMDWEQVSLILGMFAAKAVQTKYEVLPKPDEEKK